MKTIAWLISGLALGGSLFLFSVPFAVAQTESSLAIRVESNQVLVPTFVFDKRLWNSGIQTPDEYRCQVDSAKALQERGINVRQTPSRCLGWTIENLAPKDFRLFEDGVEQTIRSVARERLHWWELFDNYDHHSEYSGTPTGKWSTSDFGSSFDWHWSPPAGESYVIAYAPPPSATGSCHQIKVSVDRRDWLVLNRTAYCNVLHSPADPLEGTRFGQEIESELVSPTKPKIPILVEAGVFYTDSGATRVHLVLEFPWNSLHREWVNGYDQLFASIGVLGMVYGKDGALATRFSDQACCPRDTPLGHFGEWGTIEGDQSVSVIPTRYETQMDLPPGGYDLRVVLSDSKKFGRVDLPLSVESHKDKPLALSSVALCKRFHRVDPPSYTEGILPSKFVPLVSKGIEFTPTADATFQKRDPMFAYFEVYVPELRAAPPAAGAAAANVQFQLRITNLATGKVQIDSGLRPTAEFVQPAQQSPPAGASTASGGSNVLHIVQEVATHDLPKGTYRLEVQATDSAGNRTPWRSADFSIR